MRTQRLARLLVFLAALGAGHSVAAEGDAGGLYFLDGIDRQDGMSASIDLAARVMRVAGDGFRLRECHGDAPSKDCISSDYFVLWLDEALPEHWSGQGIDYALARSCSMSSPHGPVRVSVIDSVQKHGRFAFYLGPGRELLGWTLEHATGTDLYLKRNLQLDAQE